MKICLFAIRKKRKKSTKFFVCLQKNTNRFTNTQSLGALFHDFLLYFGWHFDAAKDVVQIRERSDDATLARRRSAGGRRMYVEDPFDLSHNLTKGVRKEGIFVFISFRIRDVTGLFLKNGKNRISKKAVKTVNFF